jgi:hypothetical protein
MNEESFKIDVSAEQQAFANVITPSEIQTPQLQYEQSEPPLPSSITVEAADFLKLPEPRIITPTEMDISTSAIAEVSKTAIDLNVKFDPESSYRNLSDQVDNMQTTLKSTVDNLTNTWIPNPRPASKFEERPSLDPTNIIFDARRARFSQYPHWA